MLTQFRTETAPVSPSATPTEAVTLASLMVEDEAVVTDAPTYRPEALGAVLLLLSPKEPSPKRPAERPSR
ncbi:hypothetical protein PUR71_31945 [Streptomyces sp. SP17BM10]|uniref:hypothetical protein n=1 Tax=Streptomyces sp. SP17BM10 TaxID=3002530 RepID=UPI002E771DE4|nr:hypothetical protein [Streptomyces sp. SP17BM10]MEE1787482.1 hypothetical protein [Streptomyces sp. SP17BM10]